MFKASLEAVGSLTASMKDNMAGEEMTFLLLTLPEGAKAEIDLQQTPVRCRLEEIPEAFRTINAGAPVGVLHKSVLEGLIKTIDEFDATHGFNENGSDKA